MTERAVKQTDRIVLILFGEVCVVLCCKNEFSKHTKLFQLALNLMHIAISPYIHQSDDKQNLDFEHHYHVATQEG